MSFLQEKYLLILACVTHVCLGQIEYICNNSTASADFQITVLLNTRYGASCDKMTPMGATNLMGDNIMRWAARTPPSLSIGLRVIDTCGSVSVNTKAIWEAVPWSRLTSGGESNEICSVGTLPNNIGVVTTSPMSGNDVIPALTDADMPLLLAKDGHHQMEPLRSSAVYLGHPISVVSQVIAKLMVELKWDFITVVYSNDRIGIDSYQMFKAEAEKQHICIDQALPLKLSSPLESIHTVGVVYLGSEGVGYELLTGQNLKNTTWITTIDVRGLNIDNGRVYSVLRSEGDLLTDALAIFGKALTKTVDDSGCTSGNIQTCGKTLHFKEKLLNNTKTIGNENMTYTINDNGVVSPSDASHNVKFDVYRHNTSPKVTTVSLKSGITTEVQKDPSLCNPEKADCRKKCGHLNNDKYLYIHGDRIIIVAIAIREEGSNPDNRWSCRNYTKLGLFRTEAARFTFNYLLKSGAATINGKRFGMLVIDSCGDKLKTTGEVYDIIRTRKDICDRNGNCLDPNRLVAFIGETVSSVTEQIQTVLRRVPLIQIAYGASSVALNDRKEYPYFLRTNPPDDLQAHFMVELLKKIDSMPGNSVTAVNLIYTNSLYGRTASQILRESLMEAGICVHMEWEARENGRNDFKKIVNSILDDKADVRLIVVIMDVNHLTEFLDAINEGQQQQAWLRRAYSFVFSDTWNNNEDLLEKYGNIIRGSFSFRFITDFTSTTFKSYLEDRTLPTMAHENPWMSTLEQMVGNCKLRGNFLGNSSTLCTTPGTIPQYEKGVFTLHFMKAIMVTVNGLKSVLSERLNTNIHFNFTDVDRWYDNLLRIKVSRTLEGGSIDHSPFTPNISGSDTYGNGGVGYSIYNIDDNKKYVLVAETGFKLSDTLEEFIKPVVYLDNKKVTREMISRSDKEHCKEPTTATTVPAPLEGLQIGLGVTGAVLGLLIVVVVALVIVFIKVRRQRQNENRETIDGYDHYLSADQLAAIKNTGDDSRFGSSCYPPPTTEQYSVPNNLPISGSNNLGYIRPIHDSEANSNTSSDAYCISSSETREQKPGFKDGVVVTTVTKV